jgi:hypothetical protein
LATLIKKDWIKKTLVLWSVKLESSGKKGRTHASLVVNLGQGNLQVVALGLVKVGGAVDERVVQLDTSEGELLNNLISIALD